MTALYAILSQCAPFVSDAHCGINILIPRCASETKKCFSLLCHKNSHPLIYLIEFQSGLTIGQMKVINVLLPMGFATSTTMTKRSGMWLNPNAKAKVQH